MEHIGSRLGSLCALTTLTVGLTVSACAPSGTAPAGGQTETKEAWDHNNRPQILGLRSLKYEELLGEAALKGAVAKKPWTDSYWPYYKKNVAFRYGSGTEFLTLAEQLASANANPAESTLSPAEKYDFLNEDPAFSVTTESWAVYDHYFAKYGADFSKWSWMGICGGWAPAAIADVAPKSPVVARNAAGREVFFFPGDIRGLMSKAYDINAMSEGYRMVGTRCNEDDATVPRDASGRAVDGKVMGTGETFHVLSDYGRVNGSLEVTRDRLHPNPYWLVAKDKINRLSGAAHVYMYRAREDVAADLAANTLGTRAMRPGTVEVFFYKSCRDVNVATLHLALVQNVSDAAPTKSGFVLELSRHREVWNHPIWGFKTQIGDAKPIAGEAPEKRVYRAPTATHYADVLTDVVYVPGSSPAIDYVDSDQNAQIDWPSIHTGRYNAIRLRYSLEFDASGLVVGGEWEENPNVRGSLPDFFWKTYGTLTDQKKDGGGPSVVKYSLLRQLLECSLRAPDTARDVMVGGTMQSVEAVACSL